MQQEWTDPRYAELVQHWRESQLPASRDPEEPPARGFIMRPQSRS
ncbi:hypothetical protein [Streptomyces sp. G-G2]|nr:hypothetical protein [Streptomyces sp. G-G2]MDJ0385863.1 hypothetical protein [Streptomyces sp. G-G2]